LQAGLHIVSHINFTFIFGDFPCEESVCLSNESGTHGIQEPIGINPEEDQRRALRKHMRTLQEAISLYLDATRSVGIKSKVPVTIKQGLRKGSRYSRTSQH
jgi:hypothetical protein